MRAISVLILLVVTVGCSSDVSLMGAFQKQMAENAVDGFFIIHLEERETDGLVLYTSWTEDYPDNQNRPGINYYERLDTGWESRPGTACSDSGVSRLGLMGNGYLFCSTLKANMDFEKILVGDTEAKMFQFGDNRLVWYAIEDEKGSKVAGISSDGRQIALN